MTGKKVLLTTVAMLGLSLGVGGVARADIRADCEHRLSVDQARIDKDAKRHGEQSRQVSGDVAKMDSDRSWCRNHKADWDHSRFDVGIYFHH